MTFPISAILANNRNNRGSHISCPSPLNYPGSKTWLIPHIRKWLLTTHSEVLIEPFAGSAIVSLVVLQERLVQQAVLIELDNDVAAFWHAVLKDPDWMAEKIVRLKPSLKQIQKIIESNSSDIMEHGFQVLVRNRISFGGYGKPRQNSIFNNRVWYPDTWRKRLLGIKQIAHQITFIEGDCLEYLSDLCTDTTAVFVDPPYSAVGGDQIGKKIYKHSNVDHAKIFQILADSNANFLMTYDMADEIVNLVHRYKFHAVQVKMRNNLHNSNSELVITRDPMFNRNMSKVNLFE